MSESGSEHAPVIPGPAPEPPVLDVHPPHQSIHGWRDFFIHIATITIGLLIALGLEQAVEYAHHRHQLAEMEESIRAEGIENQAIAIADMKVIEAALPAISAAIDKLQAPVPHGSDPVPALSEIGLSVPGNSAWSAARDVGLLALAPHDLVDNGWKVYFVQDAVVQQIRKAYADLDQAQALVSVHPDNGQISPAQRDSLLAAYAGYRESLKVLKIDLDLLNRATGLTLRGEKIDPGLSKT